MHHTGRGTKQKKVLLLITNGVDRHSKHTNYEELLRSVQQTEAVIYVVMLPGHPDERNRWEKARQQLLKLAQVTGGQAYFPISIDQVRATCGEIARDIRSQYILAYYSTNRARDSRFRTVRVEVKSPQGSGRLIVRTRAGYNKGLTE